MYNTCTNPVDERPYPLALCAPYESRSRQGYTAREKAQRKRKGLLVFSGQVRLIGGPVNAD